MSLVTVTDELWLIETVKVSPLRGRNPFGIEGGLWEINPPARKRKKGKKGMGQGQRNGNSNLDSNHTESLKLKNIKESKGWKKEMSDAV